MSQPNVELWTEMEQLQDARDAAARTRELARLQAAQGALLAVEHYFKDCPKVGSLGFELAWPPSAAESRRMQVTVKDLEGKSMDPNADAARLAYAMGVAEEVEKAWPLRAPRQAVSTRGEPFAELGPLLLGAELWGAWRAKREARAIESGVEPVARAPKKGRAI